MKKVTKLIVIITVLFTTIITAQKNEKKGILMTLDMKPVLQMDMTSPEMISFVFDKKSKYYKGIKKEKATVLKVTSTVKWDLYAVGRSKNNTTNGNTFWDQETSYGTSVNSVADIPLSLLEIKQNQVNKGAASSNGKYADYSQDFKPKSAGNSLYVAENGIPSPPSKSGKYIAGHSGKFDGDDNDYMHSGTYAQNNGIDPNFYYEIDYRILPGYPAIFPNAFNEDASIAENIVSTAQASAVLAGGAATSAKKSYAEAGVYTMNVQYILLEDQ